LGDADGGSSTTDLALEIALPSAAGAAFVVSIILMPSSEPSVICDTGNLDKGDPNKSVSILNTMMRIIMQMLSNILFDGVDIQQVRTGPVPYHSILASAPRVMSL